MFLPGAVLKASPLLAGSVGSVELQRVLGAAGSLSTVSVVPHQNPIRTRHLGGGAVVSICSCQGNLCNLLLSSSPPILTPSIFILVFQVAASLLLWQHWQWVSFSREKAFTDCCHNRTDFVVTNLQSFFQTFSNKWQIGLIWHLNNEDIFCDECLRRFTK